MTPDNQHDADLQVISALEEAGSNMSMSHRLEHHFESKKRASLESLRDHALSRSYLASEILSIGLFSKTYYFDVITDTVPTIDNITPITAAMHQLAAEYSCSYDGWGCGVVE